MMLKSKILVLLAILNLVLAAYEYLTGNGILTGTLAASREYGSQAITYLRSSTPKDKEPTKEDDRVEDNSANREEQNIEEVLREISNK